MESSEGEFSDTDLDGRGKWVVQGAEGAKDEEGFEPVVRRASRRLAKKERQRELERERAEKAGLDLRVRRYGIPYEMSLNRTK